MAPQWPMPPKSRRNRKAHTLAKPPNGTTYAIEHPSGSTDVVLELIGEKVYHAGIIRTARKLMDGVVFRHEF